VPPTCHVSPTTCTFAHPHPHTPIALQPAEEVVGGEIVLCAQLGEELFGHLVDLIAEDALLLEGIPAANAGERRLPGTVEGLRRPIGPQVTADERVQTRQRKVGAPWTHVQPARHALLGEPAVLPTLPQARVCGDETYIGGMAPASLEERLFNLALSLRWNIAAVKRHLLRCSLSYCSHVTPPFG
jgi:hypothetical protein